MREPRVTHNQASAAALLPPPNPRRTEIQIDWKEEAAMTMKIRRHYLETARQVCRIKLNPGYRQEQEARFALATAVRRFCDSGRERPVT